MIVRKIRPEEFKRCQQLCALAFEYAMPDPALSAEALLDKVRSQPRSMQDVHWDSQWAAFGDDDRTMLATMTVVPWTTRFDGHAVPMGGIGGVASLPQYRRTGAIRGCFGAALRDMYDGGTLLSYLYPFSTAFYRRFGYELGCDWARWRLNLSGMPAPDVKGAWRLSEPGCPLTEDIRAVDALRQARYNCMVIGEDIMYRFLEDERVYLIKAYANGLPLDNNAFQRLDISDLAALSYKVTAVDARTPSDDATLASLKIGSLTLSPTFAAATDTYTASTTNASNVINAVPADAGATVAITLNGVLVSNGSALTWSSANSGVNTVLITVTAEDGETQEAYTVTVTKS